MFVSIVAYFRWHYTKAYFDIWGLWNNFLWFGYHFFSLPLLLRTLFLPLFRIREKTARFDLGEFFENLLVNTVMRLVGFVLRTAVLIIGAAALFLILAIGVTIFVFWAFLPLFILYLFMIPLFQLV